MNDYLVVPVELSKVRAFIEDWHYSKSVNGLKVSQCYGLYDSAGTLLGGDAIWSAVNNIMEKVCSRRFSCGRA